MKGIITLDIGTSSMRAILYDADARARHTEQHESLPTYFADGRVEQDPLVWQTALSAVLTNCRKAALGRGIEPSCVAVTAQRSSVIPVDDRGHPLYPAIMWQDRRAVQLAEEMAEFNGLVYRRTGLTISSVFSAVKMAWLRKNRPDIWSKTHKLLGIQDWVVYLLSGRFVTDHSFGSRTNLLDLAGRCWDDELLSLFGVECEKLCELVPPGSIVGGLTPRMSQATGLVSGLPVVTAGGDQQCAALGLGLFSAERAVSNTGTGSYLIGHSETPSLDASMRLSCNASAVPGAYIVEAAVLASGIIYRWFKEMVSRTPGVAGEAFEALNTEAEQVAPGSNGLLLLPHFKGRGSPYWDTEAKGVFFNLTLTTTRGEMARAILEGIAIELQESLELVEQACGKVQSVSVSGGMTQSALFNQIQSDVLERPVVCFGNNEATSLGAWIAGAVATGLDSSYPGAYARASAGGAAVEYRPNPVHRETYAHQRRKARALYRALAAPEFRESLK